MKILLHARQRSDGPTRTSRNDNHGRADPLWNVRAQNFTSKWLTKGYKVASSRYCSMQVAQKRHRNSASIGLSDPGDGELIRVRCIEIMLRRAVAKLPRGDN